MRGKKGIQKKKLKAANIRFIYFSVTLEGLMCSPPLRLQGPGHGGEVSTIGFVFWVPPQSHSAGQLELGKVEMMECGLVVVPVAKICTLVFSSFALAICVQ